MKRSLLVLIAIGTFACGGSTRAPLGGGKEGAANAVFTLGQASLSQDGFLDSMASGAAPNGFTRDCVGGGSVTVTLVAADAPGGTGFSSEYNACNIDGGTIVNGKATLLLKVEKVGDDVAASVGFSGTLALSGDVTDTLEFDVTQGVSLKSLRTRDAAVTLTLRGHVQTTAQRYTFVNEPITLKPGKLQPATRP